MRISNFAAVVAVATSIAGFGSAKADNITLQMVVWNYSTETIQANLKDFEAANPGIKVQLTDFPWTEYENAMVLRFKNKTPTDVIYGGQDWLPAWASAGFLAPLDDVAADQVADLKKDLAPFALSDVTYKGKVYGLPYYADTISLLYNKKILADAGIAVPQTWEDMLSGLPPAVIAFFREHNDDFAALQAWHAADFADDFAIAISDLRAAPHPTLAYIGADDEWLDLTRQQSAALPCRLEIVPGDHAMAFRQSENVLPRVLSHLEAGELADSPT